MKKAFTVLELAIVLILIGILIGIVIRGATSTASAKIDATIECYRINLTSCESYFQLYRVLPGDLDRDGRIEVDSALIILKNANFDVKLQNPYGGYFKLIWVSGIPGLQDGNYLYSFQIPISTDSLIDARIDDGNLATGKYRRIGYISYLKL
ncbi:MAG: hypothetical protein ABIM42_00090 [candidate division WOR-3 bacterium]